MLERRENQIVEALVSLNKKGIPEATSMQILTEKRILHPPRTPLGHLFPLRGLELGVFYPTAQRLEQKGEIKSRQKRGR